MHFARIVSVCALALAISACADKADKISASYVSPLKYNSYTCTQLEQEYARLSEETVMVVRQQNDIAGNDAVAMGVGLILLWPSLFFIDSDDKKEEVARLKGSLRAVDQAAIQKDCVSLSKAIEDEKKRASAAKKK